MNRTMGQSGTALKREWDGMAYSIREAAEAAGVSKSTIQRLTKKNGGLSKNEEGKIELSELSRFYPDVVKSGTNEVSREPSHDLSHGTKRDSAGTAEKSSESMVLQIKLEAVQKLADEREQELHHRDVTISDLRERLDKSEQKRDEAQTKLTALLTDMRPTAPEKPIERPSVHPAYWVALVAVIAALGAAGLYLGILPGAG